MRSLEEVNKLLRQQKVELAKKYGVKEIAVFGSFVRGEQKVNSDIDILVDFEPEASIGFFKFLELEEYLENILNACYP
jgi:hypothetical protein